MDEFKTFEQIIAGMVAGTFDGKVRRQGLGVFDDDMVSVHEAEHQTLLAETTDGWILLTLQGILEQGTSASPELRQAAKRLYEELFAQGLEVHECFATYMGIYRCRAERRPSLLDELTAEYRAYYQKLSDVVDNTFQNPGARRLVARAISVVALCPPRLNGALDSWDDLATADEAHDPRRRLHLALDAVRSSDAEHLTHLLQGKLARSARNARVTAWEFDGPEEWSTSAHTRTVEDSVGETFREWLCEKASLGIAPRGREHWQSVRALARRSGFDIGPWLDVPDELLHTWRIEREAYFALESRIVTGAGPLPDSRGATWTEFASDHDRFCPFSLFGNAFTPDRHLWALVGEPHSSGRFSSRAAVGFHSRSELWSLLAHYQGASTPSGDALATMKRVVIVARSTSDMHTFRSYLETICPRGLPQLCFYWLAARSDLIDAYRDLQPSHIKMTCSELETHTTHGSTSVTSSKLLIYELPSIGPAIRLLSSAAFDTLVEADMRMFNGKIPFVSVGNEAVEAAGHAAEIAVSCMTEF